MHFWYKKRDNGYYDEESELEHYDDDGFLLDAEFAGELYDYAPEAFRLRPGRSLKAGFKQMKENRRKR